MSQFARFSLCSLLVPHRILGGLLAVLFLGLSGCPSSKTIPRPPAATTTSSSADAESLQPALDTLKHLEASTSDDELNDLTYYLNRWGGKQEITGSWKADELIERLPRQLRDQLPTSDLERATYDRQDARYLQETSWFRDISQWVSHLAPDPHVAAWARQRSPALEREQLDALLLAERLFDWTVRNIQLNPLLPYPTEGAAVPSDSGKSSGTPRLPPYAVGFPGPGYMRQPWQTLLQGNGDAWERARVFTGLARQHEIEVVTLAIYDVKVSPRPQPWLSAAFIGDELYLFDTTLGLPLPIPKTDGIATWRELREHPEWLEALDVDASNKYPIKAAQLAQVVALIDAPPVALARRNATIEEQLVGDNRMILRVSPSALADRLKKIPGITSASLWTLPWEADLFASVVRRSKSGEPPPYLQVRIFEESFFQEKTPMVIGRRCHFRGQFANRDEVKGAKSYYLDARLPDDLLDRIMTDRAVQERLGLVKQQFESDAAFGRKLMISQAVGRESKSTASYWLGIVHFESGQFDVAADWFKTRTLELQRENRWKGGARYNLARCYEQLGKSVDARLLYLEDQSPQKHGNALRARRLAERAMP